MSSPRTVVEQLLDSRSTLAREVERLHAMIAELDAVIGGLGGSSGTPTQTDRAGRLAAEPSTGAPPQRALPALDGAAESPAESVTASGDSTRQPKSIRVHVLEMLAAENRDFQLAEIIDRIHAAGIKAHDDAVRSITIKLMKDGRVDRVGRGLYRLAEPEPTHPDPAAVGRPPLDLSQPWVPLSTPPDGEASD